MSAVLPNTTTTNAYTGVQLGGDRGYLYGSLTIANNPVSIILKHGQRGEYTETEYTYITPSTLPLVGTPNDQIVGLQIKSAIAGSPAQVSGWLVEPDKAGIQPGAAFTSQVAASGSVTPGQSSVQVQHNGTLVGTEPIIDFVDGGAAFSDDAANTRVLLPAPWPTLRKTTTKQVVNTITETDLLNGEISISGNLIGINGTIRLTAWGDWLNNTGGPINYPRLKVKLGAVPTVVIDTNTAGAAMSSSASRFPWRVQFELQNLGATNSQWVSFEQDGMSANGVGNTVSAFATGEGDSFSIGGVAGFGWIRAQGCNSSAIDTTVAMAVQLTTILATNSPSHDMTLKGALVEVVPSS